MKVLYHFFCGFIALVAITTNTFAQRIDSIQFFLDEKVIDVSLSTDIKALQSQKGNDIFQDGMVTMRFPDSTVITEKVGISPRGVYRRNNCRIPPMMIDFRKNPSSKLSSLGKLKLVLGCNTGERDELLLLKEYITYKVYNQLENKSFRVRLLKVNYSDTKNKVKPFTQYSFFIEDDADMARRNNCKKKKHGQYLSEATNRDMMTMVSVFQYMVGNTDWSVPNSHNVKLIFDRTNDDALPYVIPYDFDYCGLVDASYAVPNEIIGTEKVTERVYRGFPRTMEELQITLDVFRQKKTPIFSLINDFGLLPQRVRSEMTNYLEDFYKTIENKKSVQSIFIDNARVN
jgi:hypothetical protein